MRCDALADAGSLFMQHDARLASIIIIIIGMKHGQRTHTHTHTIHRTHSVLAANLRARGKAQTEKADLPDNSAGGQVSLTGGGGLGMYLI